MYSNACGNGGKRCWHMVDEERATRLASGVLDDVSRLRSLAATEDLVHQPDQLDAVKYRFVTAIEGCVGIAHHITVSEGWAVPEGNAAALRGLGEYGVVEEHSRRPWPGHLVSVTC